MLFGTIIVSLIAGGYSTSHTCCYGDSCPFPLFNQYFGNVTTLYQNNVLSTQGCCPSGGKITITWFGDQTSDCVCSKKQSKCPTLGGSAVACPHGYPSCNGYTVCPDANFEGICNNPNDGKFEARHCNFTSGTVTMNSKTYCPYTPDDGSTRAMGQRCPISDICLDGAYVNNESFSGTYAYVRLWNGFPAYQISSKDQIYIVVWTYWPIGQTEISQWAVTYGQSPWTAMPTKMHFLPYDIPNYEFNNPASVQGITAGQCIVTTTTTTTTTTTGIPTPSPTDAPSKSDDISSYLVYIFYAAGSVAFIAAIMLFVCKCRKWKQAKSNENALSDTLVVNQENN